MLSILQVYAPTEAAGDAEIEEFYKTIDKALDTAHKTIILMGDFNAKESRIKYTNNRTTQLKEEQEILKYRETLSEKLTSHHSTYHENTISPVIEARQPVEQAGFRKGFSTIDHIHTLELIIEKYRERQRPLYLGFIDYQKAFDSVTHDSIWQSLKELEVDEVYIKVIRNIYSNSIGRIKLETLGPSFPIERGVRQGDPLSPIIFIAILEVVINKLNWSKRGIFIRDSYLSHLRFADDLVILSESSSQLQLMIEDLQTASTNVGLQINLSKTMAMSNSLKNLVKVNEYPLEYTDKYIYLGKTISFKEKNNELEIERRIQRSWNKYWSMKEVFKSDMPINLKTRIMNSSILPCLTYGCQTWKFTPKAMQKITTCQRAMERSMLKEGPSLRLLRTFVFGQIQTEMKFKVAVKLPLLAARKISELHRRRGLSRRGPPLRYLPAGVLKRLISGEGDEKFET
ncbi:Retrovirus-related Pol polyprotein from type-2 retrotransposable element R2DM; Endonuclease [Eumeta japonica]|uniref:Retrovirus-related Pol polyprotein from type-2 retrotransposable element R2DM Endonuclease n=1 Tax=Eumeta variegata TaxID=151549 RepID=A0A4C1WBY6_EUMVA|nr:Retrovirus-related Pol polyprotein from type-2 retrotransposable element R2DM; Endonuclease [Eumeta japonica]